MCTKELKWELESSDQVNRAKVLAITSVVLKEIIETDEVPFDLVDNYVQTIRWLQSILIPSTHSSGPHS